MILTKFILYLFRVRKFVLSYLFRNFVKQTGDNLPPFNKIHKLYILINYYFNYIFVKIFFFFVVVWLMLIIVALGMVSKRIFEDKKL